MQIFRFLIVGSLNTIVGLSAIYLIMYAFGLNYIAANLIGYFVGFVIAFLLNKSWTFRYEGDWAKSFIRWIGIATFAYMVNLGDVPVAVEIVK